MVARAPARLVCSALFTLLAVGACVSKPQNGERSQAHESVDEILSQPLDAQEYGTARRCISQFGYRDFQPLGDHYVLFRGPGNKLWLNELKGSCPGLHRGSALAFDSHGSQICALDQFKVADWFDWARYRRWPWQWLDGIPCTLGTFEPVTETQVEAVRASLQKR